MPRIKIIMAPVIVIAAMTCQTSIAEPWRVSGGITLHEGAVIQIDHLRPKWNFSLGYVSEQTVDKKLIWEECGQLDESGNWCRQASRTIQKQVDGYVFGVVERVFRFRDGQRYRPLVALGLAAQSATNPIVSTPINFSLSLGLGVGERLSFHWRHLSNADLKGPNIGQDFFLVSWGL